MALTRRRTGLAVRNLYTSVSQWSGIGCCLVALLAPTPALAQSNNAAKQHSTSAGVPSAAQPTQANHPAPAISAAPEPATPSAGQGAAAAAPISAAEQRYKTGDALYQEGDYEGALRAFERAYQLSAHPLLLFNMANTLERSGNYGAAAKKLRAYAVSATSEERATILKRIEQLETRVVSKQTSAGRQPPRCNPTVPSSTIEKPQPPSNTEVYTQPSPPLFGYALVGLGVASLGAASFLAMLTRSTGKEAQAACTSDGLCPRVAEQALADERNSAIATDVALAIGTLSLLGGSYLIFSDSGATQVQADLSVGHQGIRVHTVF